MLTDEQYLDYLCDTEKNTEFDKAMSHLLQQEDLGMKKYIEGLGLNADELRKKIMDGFDPSNTFKFMNDYIDKLRKKALSAITQDEPIAMIPVGTLSTPDVNACAVRNPDGGPIILLNIGLSNIMHLYIQSFFGFYYWHTEEPYCRDHSQSEFSDAVLALANYVISDDRAAIKPVAKILSCPSRPYIDKIIFDHRFGCELFVLLHEYGHILLNHLDSRNTRAIVNGNGGKWEIYNKSQRQEFEADKFSFNKLIQICSSVHEAQFFIALVIKFFELCEYVGGVEYVSTSSHPPASRRWEMIKQLAKTTDKTSASELGAASLDSAFSYIMGR